MINQNRIDLTDWIIHFVHRRNSETDPSVFSIDPDTGDYLPYPDRFTYEGEPEFLTNEYEEQDFPLAEDEYAYVVLKKILRNGYLKAGWSFRNFKPTIYGPKAAVCFTEMPLYGLIEYAKTRKAEYYTEDYGIAFLKSELFQAGARPVIYGLSSQHMEAKSNNKFYGIGLRTLSSECGLGLREQFRYVATKLSSSKNIDWTHEREWRWADVDDRFDEPGMPFYLQNDCFSFGKIIVIVKTNEEAEDIIDFIKTLFDATTDDYGRELNVNAIKNTFVLSLEQLSSITVDLSKIRLEDIPLRTLTKIKKIIPSAETLKKVKEAWDKAQSIGYSASKDYYDNYPFIRNGERLGPCGFCNIITYEAHTEITEALLQLEIATSIEQKYIIYGLKTFPSQLLDIEESGAKAAAEFLTKELGQNFYTHSRLD